MAKAQITAVLKAHYSTGIARYTWTVYPGHDSEYCLEGGKKKYFNRSIRTCRVTGQRSEQDVNTWSLFVLIIGCCCFLSLSHRPTPPGVDETGGQQDISLYEIQDSSVQGSTTVYLIFSPFAFHFYAVTCP